MDAFFAAVEQRDHPEYRGKPVIVGGDPKSRGVVSTASYEARRFGIRSAMPSAQAFRLCPQGIFLRPHFEKYQAVSKRVMAILHQHTALVEPASLDEAYLDVTENRLKIEDPIMIACMIKQSIHAVTQLTASAGVAPNMFLAKVASDLNKPDGLTVVHPGEVTSFLENLPVRKIPGVGPVTEAELLKLGLATCGQLAGAGKNLLLKHFGKWGSGLLERARGNDDRRVEPGGESKQYSTEETFARDTKDVAFLKSRLQDFAAEIYSGLEQEGRPGKTVVLKIKYHDFEQITRSQTLGHYLASAQEIYKVACRLLDEKTLAGKKPVRLIGLGLSGLKSQANESAAVSLQKELF